MIVFLLKQLLFCLRSPLGLEQFTALSFGLYWRRARALDWGLSDQLTSVACFLWYMVKCTGTRLSPVTCHLSPVNCHMSPVTFHLSPVTCFLLLVTCRLSPVICHLPPVIYHLHVTTATSIVFNFQLFLRIASSFNSNHD